MYDLTGEVGTDHFPQRGNRIGLKIIELAVGVLVADPAYIQLHRDRDHDAVQLDRNHADQALCFAIGDAVAIKGQASHRQVAHLVARRT